MAPCAPSFAAFFHPGEVLTGTGAAHTFASFLWNGPIRDRCPQTQHVATRSWSPECSGSAAGASVMCRLHPPGQPWLTRRLTWTVWEIRCSTSRGLCPLFIVFIPGLTERVG